MTGLEAQRMSATLAVMNVAFGEGTHARAADIVAFRPAGARVRRRRGGDPARSERGGVQGPPPSVPSTMLRPSPRGADRGDHDAPGALAAPGPARVQDVLGGGGAGGSLPALQRPPARADAAGGGPGGAHPGGRPAGGGTGPR